MRACLFGTYNRGHSANRIYAAAARAAGYELIEIHEPLWEKTRDKGSAYFAPLRLVGLGMHWIIAASRLARRWWRSGGAGVAIVGFNGQLDILLLRLIAPRYGPRIVFAPLVSITETLVDDRQVYSERSPMARLLRAIDRLSCRFADVVVADTHEHRRYFIERLGVDPARVAVCHLGVDNEMFSAQLASARKDGASPSARAQAGVVTPRKLEVLYFGQYLPLHGLDVVVDAVGRLATREDLRFVFIGTGEERIRIEPLVRTTRADVEFLSWVPYSELGDRVASADVVLGIFGSSEKARMVIPNKVYEAAAVGRAVVSADTPAMREVFTDGEDIVLCKSEGTALASAIARLADDAALRERIAASAAHTMRERFAPAALGRAWSALLDADASATAARPLIGITILNFNDADATLRCLASLAQSTYTNTRVLVVDNGSSTEQRRKLEAQMAGRFDAKVRWLDANLGYAAANNLAVETLFDEGCEYVLLLNDDTIVTPDAVATLVRSARRHPGGGPVGPRIARDWPGAPAASLGERYWGALLWAPRSLLRYRRPRQRAYPVRGLMGCAVLFSRTVWDRLGGFDESLFAYYEEVDLCLRSRRAGLVPRVEPMAEIAHEGHRGFAAGFTATAAYLKARNLWRVGMRVGMPGVLLFVPGYFALLAASTIGYFARGRTDVVQAMYNGAGAGMRDEKGKPPPGVFASGASAVRVDEGPQA